MMRSGAEENVWLEPLSDKISVHYISPVMVQDPRLRELQRRLWVVD